MSRRQPLPSRRQPSRAARFQGSLREDSSQETQTPQGRPPPRERPPPRIRPPPTDIRPSAIAQRVAQRRRHDFNYEFDTSYRYGRIPRTTTFRYIETAEEIADGFANDLSLAAFEVLAQLAQRELTNVAIRAFQSVGQTFTREQVRERVRVVLVMTSIENGNATSATTFQTLGEINAETMLEQLTRVQQSDTTATISTMEFGFSFDPNSIVSGGATQVEKVVIRGGYENEVYKKTHSSWIYQGRPINCAAYALNYAMNSIIKRYNRLHDDSICQAAAELQTRLGWGAVVTLNDLRRFIQVFPEFRLTCLFAGFRDNSINTWTGSSFNQDTWNLTQRQINSPRQAKVIYLMLDLNHNHYIAIHSPQQFYSSIKNGKVLWCHKCTLMYFSNYTHNCDTYVQGEPEPKKEKIRRCEFCNVYVESCTCAETRCSQCRAKRKKGYTENYPTPSDHRCIVYKNPERPKATQKFNETTNADGGSPYLWAYDFESRTEIRVATQEYIHEFETTEDFRYTGNVITHSREVKDHKVNFVVAINVFTNERKIFEGDECVQDFLLFMAAYNEGKNVLYAHNAAGYDTRLLFEIATRMEGLETAMMPILRGGKFMQLKIGILKLI